MKKFLTFLCVFALSSASVFAGAFPDVKTDNKNYEAIEYLNSKSIISGYPDGTFNPSGLVNRAEAVKIIVGAFGVSKEGEFDVLFPDVPKSQWFFSFVMGAHKAGIVNGYSSGNFKPGDTVNLAETLKMIVLAAKVTLPAEIKEDVFLDVPKTSWYAPHAEYARNHNVILSDDYGNLHAEQAMTRGSFAEVIYRMKVVLENKEKAFPIEKNWPVFDSRKLPFKVKYDDKNWKVQENEKEVVFYRADKEFLQYYPGRMYLNSAVVRVILDPNEQSLTKQQYFDNLKLAFPYAQYTEFKLSGFSSMEIVYPKDRIVDWYIYLSNGDVLTVYTEYGKGVLGFQLQQVIKAMLSTLEYSEVSGDEPADYTGLLNEIFAAILKEGQGMTALNKLPEKTIIETDTIGVGTGPVDYYYSEKTNYTFKYERAADVILDKRQGKTSAF